MQERAPAREEAAERHAREDQGPGPEVAPEPGYGHYGRRGGAAADEGAERNYIGVVYLYGVIPAHVRDAAAEDDYAERRAEGRALAHAQRGGAGEGVIEHALHHGPAHAEGRADEYRRRRAREAYLEEHAARRIAPASEERGERLAGREAYGARPGRGQGRRREQGEGRGEGQELPAL